MKGSNIIDGDALRDARRSEKVRNTIRREEPSGSSRDYPYSFPPLINPSSGPRQMVYSRGEVH
jgi:hypothetical protein